MVIGLSHSSENVVSLESIDNFTRVNYFEPLVDYLHHLSCASLRQQATRGRARDVYHFSHILHTPSAVWGQKVEDFPVGDREMERSCGKAAHGIRLEGNADVVVS